MINPRELKYPVFVVESKAQKYAIFNLARAQSDFVVFTRLPPKGEYVDGMIFDAGGSMYTYKGSSGSPRFGSTLKAVLEAFIIPSLIAKVMARFVCFGPTPLTSRKLDLNQYRESLMKSMRSHTSARERLQLEALLQSADTYKKILASVDWWRFHGGKRDEDGHPVEDN
jgi:hypothetical protein